MLKGAVKLMGNVFKKAPIKGPPSTFKMGFWKEKTGPKDAKMIKGYPHVEFYDEAGDLRIRTDFNSKSGFKNSKPHTHLFGPSGPKNGVEEWYPGDFKKINLDGFTEIQECSVHEFEAQYGFHDSRIAGMRLITDEEGGDVVHILHVSFKNMSCSPSPQVGWKKNFDIDFILHGSEYVHIGDFGYFGGGTLDYTYLDVHAEEYYSDEEPKTKKYFILVDDSVILACRKLYFRVL
jgi:hypothetical protein